MKVHNVALVKFVDGDGNILLNRRGGDDRKMWGIIGGGIEDGERPEMAIKREVSEELGYELDKHKDELTYVRKLEMDNDSFSATIHLFEARCPGLHHFSDSDEVSTSDLKLFPLRKTRTLPLMPMAREVLLG